ncbi:MAG: precorrin-6y C5,15-methyltransferase (decarboxylating) subunit CbiE [Chloroflexota bacterium]
MTQAIAIIGISAAGAHSLSIKQIKMIGEADILVGGERHLRYFPDFTGERLIIAANIAPVITRLQNAISRNEKTVVLASGDPLCFGIGSTLLRYFPREALHIFPAPTAFQLAFAALAEPWHDARFLSAHGRALADVVSETMTSSKVAILTDNEHTPAVIAQALIKAGLSIKTPCAVCENLGGTEQRIIRTQLGPTGQTNFASLNVLVVYPLQSDVQSENSEAEDPTQSVIEEEAPQISNIPVEMPPPASPIRLPGLDDDEFSTENQQITKREIRLLCLAELALLPNEVMWDIGAGSGAVSIEAARAQPTAQVHAIEKRSEMIAHIQDNLGRFQTTNVDLKQGTAPQDLINWPDPNAVFIGGSGDQLAKIIQVAQERLRPSGRLVMTIATLDSLLIVRRVLPKAKVTQVQVSRGKPILDTLRLDALNPVFIVTWGKSDYVNG